MLNSYQCIYQSLQRIMSLSGFVSLRTKKWQLGKSVEKSVGKWCFYNRQMRVFEILYVKYHPLVLNLKMIARAPTVCVASGLYVCVVDGTYVF